MQFFNSHGSVFASIFHKKILVQVFLYFLLIGFVNMGFANPEQLSLREVLEGIHSQIIDVSKLSNDSNNPKYFVFEKFKDDFITEYKSILAAYNGHPILDHPSHSLFDHYSLTFPSENYKRLYDSLSRIAASYAVLYQMGIILNVSIIVEKDSPEIGEKLEKLDYALGDVRKFLIAHYSNNYFRIYYSIKLSYVFYFSSVIENNLDHLWQAILEDRVNSETSNNYDQVFFRGLAKFIFPKIRSLSSEKIELNKGRIGGILSSNEWAILRVALENIPIQDSSEIDGFDESMRKTFHTQIGFQLMGYLLENLLVEKVPGGIE